MFSWAYNPFRSCHVSIQMRYGSYTCVYLRSSALECIHAFKIRIFFVYTVHDMMCLTSYSKTACMTAQNRQYFPKILMSFSTTTGSSILSCWTVCVCWCVPTQDMRKVMVGKLLEQYSLSHPTIVFHITHSLTHPLSTLSHTHYSSVQWWWSTFLTNNGQHWRSNWRDQSTIFLL